MTSPAGVTGTFLTIGIKVFKGLGFTFSLSYQVICKYFFGKFIQSPDKVMVEICPNIYYRLLASF